MKPLPRARKRFGQNFLVNTGAIGKIIAEVGRFEPGEILEIGPGRGALTSALLDAGHCVTAVEIDRDLAAHLQEELSGDRFSLEERDILEAPLVDLLDRRERTGPDRFLIVGNLPYNISKPIVQKLIRERSQVAGAVLMFQKEVATRLTASPASRDYGPLGILAGTYYRIRSAFDLAPGSFNPPPKVTSTVTVWTLLERPVPDPVSEARLRNCLETCFRNRRQTLFNNLRHGLAGGEPAASALLEASGLDGNSRAEALGPDVFHALARLWPVAGG